jgi:thiol-disulfide isomerase/thioredoxin
MTRFRVALGVIVAAIAAVVAITLVRPPSPPSATSATAGAVVAASERPKAPDFTGIDAWINSPPLSLPALRGRVVLIDFWTFSCVNCVRTIPHLRQLDSDYRGQGLRIVGVHSPEFDFEKRVNNVRAAVQRLGVTWAVAVDSRMATWNAFNNRYWPAEYLIDQQGRIAYTNFGEGRYQETSAAIASLLSTHPASPPAATELPSDITGELYAGSERGTLADDETYGGVGQPRQYADTGPPHARDEIQVTGTWTDHGQYLSAVTAGHVRLEFHGDSAYVVAGGGGRSASVTVTLDGAPVVPAVAGPALRDSALVVSTQDLYPLLTGVSPGYHLIDLAVPAGFQLYTFTFG